MTNTAPVPESSSIQETASQVSLKSRVISGSMWTMASYGASQVLRLGGNLIFARLLFPEAFGLMALVNIFIQGLVMFSDIGIGPSIIQSRRGEDLAFLNTAWSIQVVRGFILWIASVAGAHPFAAVYGEPQLAALIPVAGLTAVISGFTSTKLFSSNRKIRLARVTLIDLAGQASGIVAMVVWCFISRSVWAIVWGSLIGTAVKTVLSHTALEGERNAFAFERVAAREMIAFGRWVFVSSSLSFLAGQIDRLILGKLVPLGPLGVYNNAFTLASAPPVIAAALVGGVLFPLLAHHSRTDSKAYERALFAARRVMLEGALFLFAGLALLSPAFFRILYDTRYADAAWEAQILTVAMWAWILMMSVERAVLAAGESRTMAISNAASLVAKVAACYAGFQLAGIVGFILGLALGYLAGHVPLVLSLRRRGIHILRQDLPYTAVATVSIGGAVLVQRWASHGVGGPWRSGVEIAVAAVVLLPLGVRAFKIGKTALAR